MTNNIHDLLHILRQRNITYLDADSYNTIDQEDLNNTLTEGQYWDDLWHFVIDPYISKQKLDMTHSDLAVNFLYFAHGQWFIQWYNPEISTAVNDLINNKQFSEFQIYQQEWQPLPIESYNQFRKEV